MKKIIAVLLLLTLALTACTALADTTQVVYKGKKNGEGQFTVISMAENDLFDNFKNLLPGDTVEQKIEVVNKSRNKIRVYMHAETVPTEDPEGFLKELRLKVVNEKKGETIFENPPSENQPITVETPANLGVFKKNKSARLTAELTVPITMGNEFQKARGEVVWVFTIEEIPDDDSPDTGDDFVMTLWLGAAAALLAAIAAVLVLLKRRGNEA